MGWARSRVSHSFPITSPRTRHAAHAAQCINHGEGPRLIRPLLALQAQRPVDIAHRIAIRHRRQHLPQLRLHVEGVGVRAVAGELIGFVISIVRRGWRPIDRHDLLGAVPGQVVGVVVLPEGRCTDVRTRIVVRVEEPLQRIVGILDGVQVVLPVGRQLLESELAAARIEVALRPVANIQQMRPLVHQFDGDLALALAGCVAIEAAPELRADVDITHAVIRPDAERQRDFVAEESYAQGSIRIGADLKVT
jgi:hypothetical protein